MLKQHGQFFKSLVVLHDLMFLSLAWWFAYAARFHLALFPQPDPHNVEDYLIAWALILLIWTAVFEFLDFYRPRRISDSRREIGEILRASCLALLIFLAVLFLIRSVVISRIVVAVFWVGSLFFLNASHLVFREGLRFLRRRGYNLRHVLIIGAPHQANALCGTLKTYRQFGLRVAGVCLTEADDRTVTPRGENLLRSRDEALKLITSGSIDQVFIALPLEQADKLYEIQEWLGDEPVTVHFVPDLGELARMRGKVEEFDGMQIISLQTSPLYGWNSLLKRAMDLTVGALALLMLAPLMGLIALAVKLSSEGPVFYRQERMGLDGKRFQILKFRTMIRDAEKLTGPVWASASDPRVTRLGRWLRSTSLDELPQLINVLRGEMSLVGPRPERPPLIEGFRRSVPRYMLRHKVKAGMTGWAQVNGWRGDTSLQSRIEHDLDYIENWSLWRDIKIILLTLAGGYLHKRAKGR